MSTFNSKSGEGNTGDANSAGDVDPLLSQFRRQPDGDAEAETPDQANQLTNRELSQPGSFSQNQNSRSPYSGNEVWNWKLQSATDSVMLPPAAPTPPVHGFGSSQFPPSMLGTNSPNVSQSGQSAELLNILKLGQQTPRLIDSAPALQNVIHAPTPTADPSGLLAQLLKGHSPSQPPKPALAPGAPWNQDPPTADTQKYLLGLLNRPKPTQNEALKPCDSAQPLLSSSGEMPDLTQDHVDGGNHALGAIATMPTQAEFLFETKNLESFAPKLDNSASSRSGSATKLLSSAPFEASDSNRGTHKSYDTSLSSRTGNLSGQALPMHIPEKADSAQLSKRTVGGRATSATFAEPDVTRVKRGKVVSATSSRSPSAPREPAGIVDRPKESVAEAISHLADEANTAARDAIARAEQQSVRATEDTSNGEDVDKEITHDLEKMMKAKTDKEFDQSAHNAAKMLKRELEKEENQAALKNTLDAELAETVKGIIDQTAQNSAPVADSWESADADEIIGTEETAAPVKVYNIPMKPWISISIRETDQPRAVFRHEAMLDIARLKKDFDQIDRNLVAASDAHLAYGMSKAGGFRVIKQEDGKDARLFTDTKDRIFNVAICTATADKTPREAALATGVSGTVYWVLLRNGDRDHLDDAHPEQYGFALPPLIGQEADAFGGVLKTRARTAAARPDYFAVGRGKSIHFIWPSFVFRHSLFKLGHDRVVDTEKLLKQFSLKVNTGKAGKDFTLSRDDTVMVTLDKSGRVKFWDVRDLTAVDRDSDPSKPLPAHTSCEVNDCIMTLTATPEGEKAWPTSVLLLDKFRPYQKLTALRYMVVGMKQNHTLQLWDLALGKVVQEFNFPHSKESDAVCSVLYHAATSMIIVGHPTRNSIYFLHLSAPKYSFKGLSQIEFIRRLEARDPSIPQPDSTAVISGIREYSLSNMGILRSLTLLESPNSQGDVDQPILFELYAMHSKGVTCLSIKQSELGWTKENRVIRAVDAVETGYVRIRKLAAMPQPQPQEPNPEPEPPVQSRTKPKTVSSQPSTHTATKVLERPKDDLPVTPVTPAKARKKKAATNHAAVAEETVVSAGAPPEFLRSTSQNKGPTKSIGRNLENLPTYTIRRPSETQVISPQAVQSADWSLATMEARIVNHLTARLDKAVADLEGNFAKLNLAQQKRDQSRDREYAISQAQLIDTVARILTENTDAALHAIIKGQFEQILVPHMANQYTKISNAVSDRLSQESKHEIHHAMPIAIKSILQDPSILKLFSDGIASEVKTHMEAQIVKAVDMAMSSLLPKMLEQKHDELKHHVVEQFENQQRGLHDELGEILSTVRAMASNQIMMQQELHAVKQQLQQQAVQPAVQSYPGNRAFRPQQTQQTQQTQEPFFVPSESDRFERKPRQQQAQRAQQSTFYVLDGPTEPGESEKAVNYISELMRSGSYEEAVVNWVRWEKHHDDIMMHAILPYKVPFMAELRPLVLLTLIQLLTCTLAPEFAKVIKGVTTGSALLKPKLSMVETSLQRVAAQLPNEEFQGMVVPVVTTAHKRLQIMIADLQRARPRDDHLRSLHNLLNMSSRILEKAENGTESHHSAVERRS